MPPTLATARLTLAVLDTTCVDVVHGLFSAPGHTIGEGPMTDVDETLQWLERRREAYATQGLAWYGVWASGQYFVGTCGLFLGSRCGSDPEIGYEIASPMRGLGYAREAAEAVTAAAHQAGARRVWATIRPANTASQRTIESTGYNYVRTESNSKGALAYYRHGPPPS